jgi:hypothetical protein
MLRRALVVAPATLLDVWLQELRRVGVHAVQCAP